LGEEGFFVIRILADSGKVSADSRDIACSNRSGTEMGTVFEERFPDSGLDLERADDLRRSSLIAARC
jgi:hypothetical protein